MEGSIKGSNPAKTEKSGLAGLTSCSTSTVWVYWAVVSLIPATFGYSAAIRAISEADRSVLMSRGRL